MRNKVQALIDIIRDARAERMSKTSYARVVRALKALEFNAEEQKIALSYLDYIDCDTGSPYPRYVR